MAVNRLRTLGQGGFSLTFLWLLGRNCYIVKCPLKKGHFALKRWFFHIYREVLFFEKYVPKQRKIALPNIVEFTGSALIQQKVPGVPLTESLYEGLPVSEQINIAHQLAEFLAKLHKKTATKGFSQTHRIFLSPYRSLFDKQVKELYQKYSLALKKNPSAQEKGCLCITDWKSSHIFYDKKNKKLGLVDFGLVHFTHPENEFMWENPIRSHLSLKMLRFMIDEYNRFKKSKPLSLERIKSGLVLWAIREMYKCYVEDKIPDFNKRKLKKMLFDFVAKVEKEFSSQ